MSKDWEPCPRCDSKKVQVTGKAFWVLLMIGLGSILFWFGFLIFPLFIIGPLLVLLSPLGALMPRQYSCQECKNVWKVDKKQEASA